MKNLENQKNDELKQIINEILEGNLQNVIKKITYEKFPSSIIMETIVYSPKVNDEDALNIVKKIIDITQAQSTNIKIEKLCGFAAHTGKINFIKYFLIDNKEDIVLDINQTIEILLWASRKMDETFPSLLNMDKKYAIKSNTIKSLVDRYIVPEKNVQAMVDILTSSFASKDYIFAMNEDRAFQMQVINTTNTVLEKRKLESRFKNNNIAKNQLL